MRYYLDNAFCVELANDSKTTFIGLTEDNELCWMGSEDQIKALRIALRDEGVESDDIEDEPVEDDAPGGELTAMSEADRLYYLKARTNLPPMEELREESQQYSQTFGEIEVDHTLAAQEIQKWTPYEFHQYIEGYFENMSGIFVPSEYTNTQYLVGDFMVQMKYEGNF